MSIPPVKMQIVLGGVKEVQKSLKTLQKSLTDLEKIYVASQKRANDKVDNDFKNSIRKRSNLIKNFEHSYIQSLERIERAENKFNRRSTSSSGGIGRVRSSRIGIGGSSAGGGISGMAGAGAALGAAGIAAAGALYVFSKAVSLVSDAIQSTANELISGVTQIGGGFSIADAMVGSAQSQRLAVQIAQNAGKNGGITSGSVSAWSQQMGGSTEFKQLEWTKALKSFQTMTGEVSGFKNNADFFGKLASVTGSSLEDLAKTAGILKTQFKDLSDTDIKDLMLRMWQSGKEGVIELTDVNKLAEITGFASMFKGDKKQNIMNIVGGAQLVAPGVGGNASEAVTRIKAVLTQLLTNSKQVQNVAGRSTMSKDQQGNWKFNSANQGYATMAYIAQKEADKLAKLVPNVRAREAAVTLGNVATDAGITMQKGESKKDYLIRLEEFFAKMTDTTTTMTELDKSFQSTKETVEYQLKTMFSNFGGQIGSQLLDALDANSGKLKEMFDKLIQSIPGLVAQFQFMLDVAPMLASAFESAIPAVLQFAIIMSKIAGQVSAIWNATRVMNEKDTKNLEDMLEKYNQTVAERTEKEKEDKRNSANEAYETAYDPERNFVMKNGQAPFNFEKDMANYNDGKPAEIKGGKEIESGAKVLNNAATNLNNAAVRLANIDISGDKPPPIPRQGDPIPDRR